MRGRQRLAIITLMLLVGAVAVAGTAGAVQAQGRTLSTTLTGAAEVPGPGDPDGSGTATLTVNPGLGQICYELTVSGIAPATAAHIHVGAVGVAGPVVVPLDPPTDGTSSGCAEVSRELALAILMSPSNYYVNVHNAEYPAGAVRGQLSK
jgi:CHRD domain